MSTSSSEARLVKLMNQAAIPVFALGVAIFLAHPADAASRKAEALRAQHAPVIAAPLVARPANGSIFQVSAGYAPLTSGARAAMVGDILTIALIERTQAVKTNSANTDRSGNIGITPPSTGPLSLFKPSDVSIGGGSKFNGTGAAAQSNALTGEITVTVAEVMPNGVLRVQGEKLVTLNRGDEQIRLTGLVRPNDIGPDNVVLSSRVADARISYSGTGEIARASRQGWLNRFFSILSPF